MKPTYELTDTQINVWMDKQDYLDKYKGVIQYIDGRRFNPERLCWEILITEDNIDLLNKTFNFGIGENKQIEPVTEEPKPLDLINYNSPVPPFKHQQIATSMMLQQERLALFMEMGTGKTKCVVDWFSIMYNKYIDYMLIICPKSVIGSWCEELTKHDIANFAVIKGTKAQRIRILEAKPIIAILNYEGVLVLRDHLASYFANPRTAIILDESSKIKSPKAERTKVICKTFEPNIFKFILSGTPITQNPIDIYPQFKFLDRSWIAHQSWYSFKNYYCIMGGFMKYQIIGYRHLPALKAVIDRHSYIVKKEECLDLPPKIYETRQLDMKPNMREQYNKMKKDMMIELANEEKVTASIILVKLLRLQQILSGCWLPSSNDNLKLKETIDIIKETDSKVIVWCRFIETIKTIDKALEKEQINHVLFYGETEDRDAVIKKFREVQNVKVFIGQVATGGMGINLQCANLVVYFENSFSLQDRLQSEDRCHRIGQDNKVTYIDLLYNDTIDKDIIKAIKEKKKIADYLIPRFTGTEVLL